ncbi:MAG TPA: riboflavin biosynthesis protein RibD, partial [Acidimicrobiaceae bacterium]|nr:riboflavin biosynthesis protein RibD [Acidimicrobiaceae bacterium]
YGVRDPDPNVSGRGLEMLSDAGIEVVEGVCSEEVKIQLEPYLHQRVTGKPWVVLKMAMTIDGRTA